MGQPFGKFLMFQNRLEKVCRHLSKTARRQGVTCYRIYDHDVPEAPLLIERYEDWIYVAEYRRNHGLDDEQHAAWLAESLNIIAEITGTPIEKISVRERRRIVDRTEQYNKLEGERKEIIAHENGFRFYVNLTDYLDTGLFLDHRITRAMVQQQSKEKKILNLFCYTGSFSVYAVGGGAAAVHSVDLSKTYLAWTARNIQLNFTDHQKHRCIHVDVKQFLRTTQEQYDLIVMDPPTFSNSKRMEDTLDTQRDHVVLINQCLHLLRPGGVLYFSTNYTRFQLDVAAIRTDKIKDITKTTTPFDFAGKLKRQCFLLQV